MYDVANRPPQRTNALGQVRDLVGYDQVGRLLWSRPYPGGPTTSNTYDAAGNLINVKSQISNLKFDSSFSYDTAGRVTRAIDPAGYSNSFSYDAAGNLASHADELGRTATCAYDSLNRLSCVTDPLGTTWSNAYDRMGNVASHMPSYCDADTFNHDALGRVVQMTSPAGSFTATYNAANLITWQAFDDGRTNQYTYDAGYRMTNASGVGAGSSCVRASYAHDAVGNLLTVRASIGDQQSEISNSYDAAGQRTSRRLHHSTLDIQDSILYDALGRVVSLSNPFVCATYLYDTAGNMTQKLVKAAGSGTSVVNRFQYDGMDRLTNLSSIIQYPASSIGIEAFSYAYEANRSLITQIIHSSTLPSFQSDSVHTYRYDAAGQLVRDYREEFQFDPSRRLMADAQECYTYDRAGRIASGIAGNQYWQDVVGFWSFDNPSNRFEDISGNGRTMSAPGNQPYSTVLPPTVNPTNHPGSLYGASSPLLYAPYDPGLNASNFTIAGFFRYNGEWFASRGSNTSWSFGFNTLWAVGSNYLTLAILNHTIRTDPRHWMQRGNEWCHLALTRDANTFSIYKNGVLLTNAVWNDAGPLTNNSPLYFGCTSGAYMDQIGYWSRALAPTEIADLYYDRYERPTVSSTTNAYQDGNMLAALSDFSNATHATLDVRADSPQDLTAWQVDANGVNAISATFNQTHTTFAVTNVPIGTNCAWAKVSLDGRSAANVDSAGTAHWGSHQPATNNQLHFKVEAAENMAPGVFPVAPTLNTTNTYDDAGQLIYQYSSTPSLHRSFSYDSARNMTRCQGNGFTNHYFYDHARRLICQVSLNNGTIESNRFIYDGMDVIAKVEEISGEIVYFTRGLGIAPGVGDVLAETHILGSLTQTYVYVQNHRGDTIAAVDSAGLIVHRYEYDAWGTINYHLSTTNAPEPWFTFSGKHFDADAGLYYYGFRWYDAVAKRWTQPDPEGLAEGLDLYRFCGNDPVNGVDVDGLSQLTIIMAIDNMEARFRGKSAVGMRLVKELRKLQASGKILDGQGNIVDFVSGTEGADGVFAYGGIFIRECVDPQQFRTLTHEGMHYLQHLISPALHSWGHEYEAEYYAWLYDRLGPSWSNMSFEEIQKSALAQARLNISRKTYWYLAIHSLFSMYNGLAPIPGLFEPFRKNVGEPQGWM